jgi:hypothetical protein
MMVEKTYDRRWNKEDTMEQMDWARGTGAAVVIGFALATLQPTIAAQKVPVPDTKSGVVITKDPNKLLDVFKGKMMVPTEVVYPARLVGNLMWIDNVSAQ